MATVNSAAFAAVDAFFGVDSSREESATAAVSNTRKPGTLIHGRLGVGAAAALPTTTTGIPNRDDSTNNVITSKKRILQVGSSKRRRKVGYGDDDDEGDVSSAMGSDSEEEEDEGRTAIDRGPTKKSDFCETSNNRIASSSVKMIGQPQQKKKLGKKERQRLAKEQLKKEPAVDDNVINTADEGQGQEDGTDTNTNKRKRRKKVRSRQKNICKDNRDVKPEHLVPGNRNYQGLPLTPATRAKLNLPVMAKSPFASDRRWGQGNWNDGTNVDTGYSGHGMNGDSLDAMPLAVDRPNLEQGQPTSNQGKTTKTGKAKKYKNLI